MTIYTKELSPELWNDFEAYFDFKGKASGCWCMNHRLPIGLNFEGEAAKLAIKQLIQNKKIHGILAYLKGYPTHVGWLSLDRKKTLPGNHCIGEKIDCSETIWSIHCVTARSDFKNKGVEEILIKASIELAKKLGSKLLESYPEPKSSPHVAFKTWNTFNGHQTTFEKEGFLSGQRIYGKKDDYYHPMVLNL